MARNTGTGSVMMMIAARRVLRADRRDRVAMMTIGMHVMHRLLLLLRLCMVMSTLGGLLLLLGLQLRLLLLLLLLGRAIAGVRMPRLRLRLTLGL